MKILFLALAVLVSPSLYAGWLDFLDTEPEVWLNDCELNSVDSSRTYIVYRQICSIEAMTKFSHGYQITPSFEVPSSLARRVNFWKLIYSYFGKDDYVIHSSEYPGIILEIVHQIHPTERQLPTPKKVISVRKRRIQKVLMEMHRQKTAEFIDPEQQRIASLMTHIADKDKFKILASSLRHQRGQSNFVKSGLRTASRYLPVIKKEFMLAGLPPEIAYIAFVESSFNTKAYSKVGAAGVYQLMKFVARKHMIIDNYVDERRDPIKSGRLAIRLLKTNYNMLGNWPLAITAYNHGPFGIKRAVRHSGSSDLSTIIASYRGKGFGFASKNFYSEFLAMLDVVSNSKRYFGMSSGEAPINFKEITLEHNYRIATILKTFAISTEDLVAYNPDLKKAALRHSYVVRKGFKLKLPGDSPQRSAHVELSE